MGIIIKDSQNIEIDKGTAQELYRYLKNQYISYEDFPRVITLVLNLRDIDKEGVEFCLGCGKPTNNRDCGCPAGTGIRK